MTSSTQVMHTMNELMKVPELKDTMSKLAREMEKAGLIQELVDDAFASIEVIITINIIHIYYNLLSLLRILI